MKDSDGWAESATDREIVDAIKLLAKTEGILTEPAGGTTLAAAIKLIQDGRIPRDESIVIAITGNGLKTTEVVQDELRDAGSDRREADRIRCAARIEPTCGDRRIFQLSGNLGRTTIGSEHVRESPYSLTAAQLHQRRRRGRRSGASVREVLANLKSKASGIESRLFKGPDQLNRFVNIYVNDEDIRFLSNLDTPVKEGDEISIIPAIAGG